MPGQSTDSDEEVIFVVEKPARRANEILINQAKRLALQRDIDQESQPREAARPWVAQGTLDMVADVKEEVDEWHGRDTLAKKEKKQKRRKQRKDEDEEEQGNSVDDESLKMKTKKDKKKKKRATNAEDSPKREKKKKQLEENGIDDVSQHTLTQEEPSGKKQKRLKKTKDKSVQSEVAGCFKTEEEEEALATKKKKSKKVTVTNQSEVINIDKSDDDEDVVMKTTTKKNKAGPKTSVTKTVAGEDESQGVHQKNKKRKAHLETGEDTLETVKKKTKKGKKEETKPIKTKKASSSGVVHEESPKTKKKKEAKGVKSDVSPKVKGDQEVSMVDHKEQKRKKKKDAKEEKQMAVKDTAQNTETFVFVACDSKGKGKKGMKGASKEIKIMAKKEEVEISVDKKRKKKIKLEEDAPEIEPSPEVTPPTDVVFLSEKTGNRDEVTINQERRLALQMDIDKESHSQSPVQPLGFGQWSTAQFDSTEKQQKFLRLMGGFKKETQTGRPGAVRPNMALAQDQQQNLHQSLLGEFERAQSRRVDFSGRGAGLGFSVAPSKKFSIDVNASRSVRFDD